MTAYDPIPAETRRHLTRVDSKIEADDEAYSLLCAGMLMSLRAGRLADMAGKPEQTILAAVADELGGIGGELLLAEMLTIVAGVARDESVALAGVAALRRRADTLLRLIAHRRADFQAGDVAAELRGEEA